MIACDMLAVVATIYFFTLGFVYEFSKKDGDII